MKKQFFAAAAAAALSTGATADAVSSEEIAQIRSQLQSLMQRVDKLEVENESLKSQNAQLAAQTAQVSKQIAASADTKPVVLAVKADWPNRIVVKGDVRYRHQDTDDRSATARCDEELLRARLRVEAKVTDSIVAAVGLRLLQLPAVRAG